MGTISLGYLQPSTGYIDTIFVKPMERLSQLQKIKVVL